MSDFSILVVDDQEDIRYALAGLLEDEGYKTLAAPDGQSALQLAAENEVDMVLLDLMLPDIDGIEVLKKIVNTKPDLPIVMISAHGTIESAVKAIQAGAYDFIEKPPRPEVVLFTVQRALEKRQLKLENDELRSRIAEGSRMIGSSPVMMQLFAQIEKIGPTSSTVLIQGESGTGKELVARTIHEKSSRAKRSFVKVNCAAIPKDLIESELFGHEKGAFTGAISSRKGKFELADKGTIFLDEIGDMASDTQAKVLRALQEGEIERVGGSATISVDIRTVAATNKNLDEEMREGRFRDDLYYRLNVLPMFMPPLRDRKEDIPLLAFYFADEFCRREGKKPILITQDAIAALQSYDWPGNVRELKNIVERLIIMGEGDNISGDDVNLALLGKTFTSTLEKSLRERLEEYEKNLILNELEANKGNISQTARNLGLDRANLQRKLRQWKE